MMERFILLKLLEQLNQKNKKTLFIHNSMYILLKLYTHPPKSKTHLLELPITT